MSMFSSLSTLFGKESPLKYDVGERYGGWSHCGWQHHKGASKDEPPAPVSVFVYTASSDNDPQLAAARAALKRMRTLRHPHVLKCLDGVEVPNGISGRDPGPVLYIVTEPCAPLPYALGDLDADGLRGNEREEYLAFGLRQLTEAVAFLNVDCKMAHGYVCASAVAVTPELDWKLHAFDFLDSWWDGPGSTMMPPSEGLRAASAVAPAHAACQELIKADWEGLRRAPPWSVDAWGLGCTIQEIFRAPKPFDAVEQLREMQHIPRALAPAYQRMLSSQPGRRLNPKKLLAQCEFFSNPLVDFLGFLDQLALKDSTDKESFFRKMPAALDKIAPVIAKRKVLPLLAKALEFGAAPASGLGSMLKIGKELEEDRFAADVLPVVVRLFSSNDRAVRISLLQNMDSIGPHLSAELVEGQVYRDLEKGFADTSAYLRELTLKTLPMLAPKMKAATLNSSALKHLAKLQVDEEPAIRTNTTICLGNIARYLGEASRKRVLINAFSRALKDVFPPGRAAGLMAMTATACYYSCEELAHRVLPAATPLLVDADASVREKAFACVDAALARLRERDEDVRAGREESDDAKGAPADGGKGMSSLLGWAASAAAAVGTSTGASPMKAPPAGGAIGAASSSGNADAYGAAAGEASRPQQQRPPSHQPRREQEVRSSGPAVVAAAALEDDDDGWGDSEEDLDLDPMSMMSGASQSKHSAMSFTDDGENDGWDSMNSPAPKAAPRPVVPRAVPRKGALAGGKKATKSLKLGAKKRAD